MMQSLLMVVLVNQHQRELTRRAEQARAVHGGRRAPSGSDSRRSRRRGPGSAIG
jgi:hypothetical protein